MTKEVIIVSLIVLVIYLYYQQNNQPNLLGNSEKEQITKLQQEVQHYQNLYQKRVEKDLEVDQTERIKELTENQEKLEQKHTEVLKLFQQKVKDQDMALINLARTKIKGKKDAEKLLEELSEKWGEKELEWEEERKQISLNHTKDREFWAEELTQKEVNIKVLSSRNDKLSEEKVNLILEKGKRNQTQKDWNIALQKCYSLYGKIPQGELVLDNFYELLKKEQLAQIKHQEQIKEYLIEQQQQERTITGLKKTIQEQEQGLERQKKKEQKLEMEKAGLFQDFQRQLRAINILFDEKAKDYEVIDFSRLYSLLEKVKAEIGKGISKMPGSWKE